MLPPAVYFTYGRLYVSMLLKKLKPGLCDDLERRRDGEEGGGGFMGEGTYVHLWLVHADGWQRPTQYGKAIIPQLKRNKF